MTRRNRTEWAKAIVGMLFGIIALAYVELLWIAHHDYFLTPTGCAQARRATEETYVRVAVCPFDEMNGDGP